MKVKYSVQETLTFSGIMEISADDYAEIKEQDDDVLSDFLLDRVDRSNPSYCNNNGVDEFHPIVDEFHHIVG